MTAPESSPPSSSLILYQTEDGQTRVQCRFEDESIWLTQALIGELFQKDVRTINEHLQNVYSEGELSREATIRKFRIVRKEGARTVAREVEHYMFLDFAEDQALRRKQVFLKQWKTKLDDFLRFNDRAVLPMPGA